MGVEADDDCRGDEDAGGVEAASAGDIARVEWKLDAGDLTAIFVGTTAGLIIETLQHNGRSQEHSQYSKFNLHVDMAFEGVACVEVDGDRGGAALDFGLAFDAVVDRNCGDSADEQRDAQRGAHHQDLKTTSTRASVAQGAGWSD